MSIENQQPASNENVVASTPKFFGKAATSLRMTLAALALGAVACSTDKKQVEADAQVLEVTTIKNIDQDPVYGAEDPTPTGVSCAQDPVYNKWKELNVPLEQCFGCHRPGGVGYHPEIDDGWEHDGSANPTASWKSFNSLYQKAARLDSNGEPYWISYAKGVIQNPGGSPKHGGGAQPLDVGQVNVMKEFTNQVRAYVTSLGKNPDVQPLPDAPAINVDCNKGTQYTKVDLFKNMEMLSYSEVYAKFLRNVTGGKLPITPVKITSKDQLRQMLMLATEDPGFLESLRTFFNDSTLTRALAKDDKAKKALGQAYGVDWSTRDNAELADSPGNLLAYVVKHNMSVKLVYTAKFVVDPGIKPTSGVDDPFGRMKVVPVNSDIAPLAGVPSDRIWLVRWPSTKTNKNRNRSRITHLEAFDLDIAKFGNSNAQQKDPNEQFPEIMDDNCISCHRGTTLDLGSRAFTDFDLVTGEYIQQKEPLPISLLNLGIYGQMIDHNASNALQQLMYLMTLDPDLSPSDPGYDPDRRRPHAQAWTKKAYRFLMGRPVSEKPNEGEMDKQAKDNRYIAEKTGIINPMADFLHDNGYNFRKLIVEMAMSEWYAATGEMNDDAELTSDREIELANVGPMMATPEQLTMRLKGFLGPDVDKLGLSSMIKGPANIELGGIDSEIVVVRQTDPTAAFELRLDYIALAKVSQIVVDELAKAPKDRHWAIALPAWDTLKDTPPVDIITGQVNKNVELQYKQTMAIILLHKHGRYFEINSPEVQALFDEWVKIWQDCMSAPGNDTIVPEFQIPGVDSSDKLKIIQAWMALITEVVQSVEFTTSQNDIKAPNSSSTEIASEHEEMKDMEYVENVHPAKYNQYTRILVAVNPETNELCVVGGMRPKQTA